MNGFLKHFSVFVILLISILGGARTVHAQGVLGFVVIYTYENRKDIFAIDGKQFKRISNEMKVTTKISDIGEAAGSTTSVDINESKDTKPAPLDYLLIPAPNDVLTARVSIPGGGSFDAEMLQDGTGDIHFTKSGIRSFIQNEDGIAKENALSLLNEFIKKPENAKVLPDNLSLTVDDSKIDDSRTDSINETLLATATHLIEMTQGTYTIKVRGVAAFR